MRQRQAWSRRLLVPAFALGFSIAGPAAARAQAPPNDSASTASARAPARQNDNEFTASARRRAYVHGLVGPGSLIGLGLATGIDQYHESPHQWGDGGQGLAKRAASNVGWLVVGQSVNHGLSILFDRSTEYHRCECRGFGHRVAHAFGETFSDVSPSGRRGFAVARVAGAFAGSYSTMLWRPGVTGGQAALDAGTSLLFAFFTNAAEEALGWWF